MSTATAGQPSAHPERDSIIEQITWTITHTARSVLVLYGSSGSGKSLVCQNVFDKCAASERGGTPGHVAVYVSAKTANGGSSSDPLTEAVFSGAVCASLHAQGVSETAQCQRTCSSVRQLARHIRSAAAEARTSLRRVTVVVDDADTALPPAMLADPSAKTASVVSMVARLPEAVCDSCGAGVNVCVLLSVREVPLCLRAVPGVVLFPLAPYTVDQVVAIAARLLSAVMAPRAGQSTLQQYAELVHSMFNQTLTGDVRKLLGLCLRYRALYESCEASSSSLNSCRALFTTKVAKARAEDAKKSAECGLVDVSDEAKKLLIASYIASHTAPSHDSFFAVKFHTTSSSSRRRRRAKASAAAESNSSGASPSSSSSSHHLNFEAKPFPIRRMVCLKLALFPKEEDDDDDGGCNEAEGGEGYAVLPSFAQNCLGTSTLEQIRELVDQHLLVVAKSQKAAAAATNALSPSGATAGSAASASGAPGAGQVSVSTAGSLGQLLPSLSLAQTLECLASRAVVAQVALSLSPPLHIEDCF